MKDSTDNPAPPEDSAESIDLHGHAPKLDWVRWTVPPGISIGVHAVLIGAVAYIGMQISANQTPSTRLPVAELALPAPVDQPADPIADTTPPDEQRPETNREQPATTPSTLDQAAADLKPLQYTKPAMDPVALAALQSSNAQIAKPESASPPRVRFAGVQTQAARTIVYVVDGSGATANSFAYLQTQLLRSIDRLSPTQQFQVVLFRSFDGHTISTAPINGNAMARATTANKQTVADWLNTISTKGRSNPVEGLRAALALKPDLVLLITRSIQRTEMGWAQGQRAILDELNTLNPQDPLTGQRRTAIKTIQLLDEDPTGIMRAIGTLHGNSPDADPRSSDGYRVVTYDDLISGDDAELDERVQNASIGASNEQRIVAASEIMGGLTQSGTSYSIFYGYGDRSQRKSALTSARQIRALASPLAQADGRAAILDAQSILLTHLAGTQPVEDQRIQAIIGTLDGVLYTEPNTDAQRVLTVAMAMDALGDTVAARTRVSELLSLADELGIDRSTRAQAVLAMVALGGIDGEALDAYAKRPPFVTPTGGIDAVWGVILRETLTKARLIHNENNPWEPMVSLRRSASENEPIANYIDARISLILSSSEHVLRRDTLPSEVLLAAANTMAHSMDQRERAIELLTEISDRLKGSDDEQSQRQGGDALWQIAVLGQAINTPESRARSGEALIELCTRYPNHERADDAIAGAILSTPNRQESVRRDRLMLGVQYFADHPQIDLWRLELAELLEDFAALDVLDPISPKTREGKLAGELYEKITLGMLDRYSDPQVRSGLGLRMRQAADRFELAGAQMWTKRAAMNEIQHDPQGAISSLDQLIREAKQGNEPTEELELMRAQTLNKLGQTRTAFEALGALSARIDATGKHTSTYWQSWALMLETIAKEGSKEDKAGAIAHIARLELIDPNLGGSPWKQRIIEARQTLH